MLAGLILLAWALSSVLIEKDFCKRLNPVSWHACHNCSLWLAWCFLDAQLSLGAGFTCLCRWFFVNLCRDQAHTSLAGVQNCRLCSAVTYLFLIPLCHLFLAISWQSHCLKPFYCFACSCLYLSTMNSFPSLNFLCSAFVSVGL